MASTKRTRCVRPTTKRRMANGNGEWRMENGELRMANANGSGERRVANGEWRTGGRGGFGRWCSVEGRDASRRALAGEVIASRGAVGWLVSQGRVAAAARGSERAHGDGMGVPRDLVSARTLLMPIGGVRQRPGRSASVRPGMTVRPASTPKTEPRRRPSATRSNRPGGARRGFAREPRAHGAQLSRIGCARGTRQW